MRGAQTAPASCHHVIFHNIPYANKEWGGTGRDPGYLLTLTGNFRRFPALGSAWLLPAEAIVLP
jgi:hypothetical protein